MTTTDGVRALVGPGERIGAMTLLRGGLGRLRSAGVLPVLVVWLVTAAGAFAPQRLAELAGVNPAAPDAGVGYLAYALGASLISGLSSAWMLRLLVQGRSAWLTFDRRFFEAAAVMAAITLGFLAIGCLYLLPVLLGASATMTGVAGLAVAVAFLAAAYATLKIMLWPIGRLTGRTEVTWRRSWRLMRKATRGLILGYLLLLAPVMVVAVSAMIPAAQTGSAPTMATTIILQFVTAAFSVASSGMLATIYSLRVENPATVADVFD